MKATPPSRSKKIHLFGPSVVTRSLAVRITLCNRDVQSHSPMTARAFLLVRFVAAAVRAEQQPQILDKEAFCRRSCCSRSILSPLQHVNCRDVRFVGEAAIALQLYGHGRDSLCSARDWLLENQNRDMLVTRHSSFLPRQMRRLRSKATDRIQRLTMSGVRARDVLARMGC